MAIEFNDNVYSKSPKPLDAKAYVGTDQLFATKELIPLSYRFNGMVVRDIDNLQVFQLQGGISDQYWEEITNSSSGGFSGITEVRIVNGTMDETTFTAPAGYDANNTVVSINGVEISRDRYDYSRYTNSVELVLEFGVEIGDVITIKKY